MSSLCPVEKNKEYLMTIDDIGNDGEGIGKIDGFTVFVKDALPKEKIEVLITKVRKNFAYGRLMKIIEASENRVEPVCKNYKRCGGCNIQHLAYNEQLNFKTKKVKDALERIGGFVGVTVKDTIGMENPYNYRNKAQFPVGQSNGKTEIGFYSPRSHNIVDIESCCIQNEANDKIIRIIRQFMEEENISAYDENTGKGLIRHILTKVGFVTGEKLVCIVINGNSIPNKNKLIGRLKSIDGLTGIVLNINKQNTNVILGKENKVLWGREYIVDYINEIKFEISVHSFFQVNPIQTRVLYGKALELAGLTGRENVLDIYCGIGTISLFLAQKAKKVVGVEIVEQAIKDAKRNAEINGIKNAEFIAGPAEKVIPEIYNNGFVADTVVVDPPRKGCDIAVLNTIINMAPKRLVYVSCDPSTMARDVKILCENGFILNEVQPVDQFCHTTHVETVVSLVRKTHDDYIHVKLDLDDLDLTASESKATYSKIKAYVLEKFGLKVSSLYIAQIKEKYGIIERENYNLPKTEGNRVPKCPKEKEDAIVDALKHFKMI